MTKFLFLWYPRKQPRQVYPLNFLEKLDLLMEREGLNRRTLSLRSGIPYTTIDN